VRTVDASDVQHLDPASFSGLTPPWAPRAPRGSSLERSDASTSLYDALVDAGRRSALASLGRADNEGAVAMRKLLLAQRELPPPGGPNAPTVDALYEQARMRSMAQGFGPGDAMLDALRDQRESRYARQSEDRPFWMV